MAAQLRVSATKRRGEKGAKSDRPSLSPSLILAILDELFGLMNLTNRTKSNVHDKYSKGYFNLIKT